MNRLADATSPYLRQHADNPVHWWPWIPEAFDEAKRRNVPVHLSIGYAACHWCHVMARESFSDPATAELLNRDFVSIKVDREERPDVDQIYMRALHALGEQGGWPLTMFLTPGGEPFWGGTYFPPEPRWGRPSFRQVLSGVSAAWSSGDAAVAQNASALTSHLNRPVSPTAGAPDASVLDNAARTILSIWDMAGGSFRGAPKFPNPVVLEVLWRASRRTDEPAYRTAVVNTLTLLCQGGIYDHVGGGFARYSVDAEWLVPHFEKMLYDNALLLKLLSLAHCETPSPLFRARIDETVGWLLREMQHPAGGFAASLDADTEHEEGLTYVWTSDDIKNLLGADSTIFAKTYGVSPAGNWEGHNILNRLAPENRGWLGDEREAELGRLRARLLAERNKRPQPARDDKVLADWNGLAISGLAHAARATGNEKARDAAAKAFRFVSESMSDGDRLAHSTLDGSLVFPGVATDYANMAQAALDLFALTGDASHLDRAEVWFAAADRHHFVDESAAYSLTADDAAPLIARPLSLTDEATPAATGTLAAAAATLFMLTGDSRYHTRADHMLRHLGPGGAQDVVGTASLQSAFDTLLRGRLAFVVGGGDEAMTLLQLTSAEADPALFSAHVSLEAIRKGHPAEGKRPTRSAAALFLCDAFSCLPEIGTDRDAVRELSATRRGLVSKPAE
ncbi:MAG: thioredoxin domain-containing protein [Propylenella sp.]